MNAWRKQSMTACPGPKYVGLGAWRKRTGPALRGRRYLRPATLVLALAGVLAGPPQAGAQGSRKDDMVMNARGVPQAGAFVAICAQPANTSTTPCSPLANLYSNAALTQALANPITTDGLGNYLFYAAPGKYTIQIYGPGITTKVMTDVILPNDPSAPAFTTVTSTAGISAFSLTLTGDLSVTGDRKSTRLNSSHIQKSRMPSSA